MSNINYTASKTLPSSDVHNSEEKDEIISRLVQEFNRIRSEIVDLRSVREDERHRWSSRNSDLQRDIDALHHELGRARALRPPALGGSGPAAGGGMLNSPLPPPGQMQLLPAQFGDTTPAALRASIDDLRGENQRLQAALHGRNTASSDIVDSASHTKTALETLLIQFRTIQSDLFRLQHQYETEKANWTKERRQLMSEISELEQRRVIESSDNGSGSFALHQDQLNAELEELEAEKTKHVSEIKQLRQSNVDLDEEVEDLKNRIKIMQAKHSELVHKMSSSNDTEIKQGLEKKLAAAEKEIAKLRSEIEYLTDNTEAANKKIQRMEEKLLRKEEELKVVSDALVNYKGVSSKKEEQLDSVTAQHDDTQKRHAALNKEATTLRSEVAQLRADAARAAETVAVARRENAQLRQEAQERTEALQEAEQQLQKLKRGSNV